MKLTIRRETLQIRGIRGKLRVLHLSDIHFSPALSYEKNLQKAQAVSELVRQEKPDMIALTGDLISRTADAQSIRAALRLSAALRRTAPVLFSLGNHETDLPERERKFLLELLRRAGVTVLDNSFAAYGGVLFGGLTLPFAVYKNAAGHYARLMPITEQLVESCIGTCPSRPCVLLAHSPMGLPAYAEWGADVVLSGHVHGGIVRVPGLGGILSPERRFFPAYTKGIYTQGRCQMQVSAGIGKLRVNNPPEIVCIDLIPY